MLLHLLQAAPPAQLVGHPQRALEARQTRHGHVQTHGVQEPHLRTLQTHGEDTHLVYSYSALSPVVIVVVVVVGSNEVVQLLVRTPAPPSGCGGVPERDA